MSLPTIVWISLESTRYDHTTFGDHDNETTPSLERIADRGTSFDRCFSHGIWTRTSSGSILTGTYPGFHGAGMDHDTVPTEFPTIAERLRDAGYRTVCFSKNAHLSSASGLDRGFDEFVWYDKFSLQDVAGYSGLLKYLLKLRRHSIGYTSRTRLHSTGYLLTEGIKERLENSAEPTFLYAHYGDPHHPYVPPRPYLDRFTESLPFSAEEALEIALEMDETLMQTVADGCEFTDDEWAAIEAMYDACLAYTDSLVGEVYDYVRSNVDDAIVVVTGDHGELLGERGLLAHRLVTHDAVTHVPLVVDGPTDLLDADGHVQHVDVMRTLLEEIGANTGGLHGEDLRETTRHHSIVQRGGPRAAETVEMLRDLNPEFDGDRFHQGTLTTVRTDEHKYERSESDRRLYDLPDEETDVLETRPDVVRDLEATLEERSEWLFDDRSTSRRSGDLSPRMKNQLQDLGYLVE